MTGRLDGRVAIITGGGSGLGEASSKRFAEEGANVLVADMNEDGAKRVASEIEIAGGTASAVHVDVTSRASNEAMASAALERYGTIDTIYCNAGIVGVGNAMDLEEDDWDLVNDVMLKGVWLSMRAVLPTMVDKGKGSIINQASIGGVIGVAGIFPYAAAKAGVIGMTRQAAVDFADKGVRINCICPGTVPTPLVIGTYEQRAGIGMSGGRTVEEALEVTRSKYPLGDMGEPLDIANMALFLASDESKWITGQSFIVDGGYTAV
ncbi:MAG: SDR family oxidoreductase [bacterium]|nr:SDR family oxidoreductase [bacterium]